MIEPKKVVAGCAVVSIVVLEALIHIILWEAKIYKHLHSFSLYTKNHIRIGFLTNDERVIGRERIRIIQVASIILDIVGFLIVSLTTSLRRSLSYLVRQQLMCCSFFKLGALNTSLKLLIVFRRLFEGLYETCFVTDASSNPVVVSCGLLHLSAESTILMKGLPVVLIDSSIVRVNV